MDFFRFEMVENFCIVISGDSLRILENIDSVGEYVCIWIEIVLEGYIICIKIYNKVVLNFEVGEICEFVGGYLVEYVDCFNLCFC